MSPEKDIERIITGVHAQSGHWPYTKDSELYVGWRVGEERFVAGSGRRLHAQITYDVAIVCGYDKTEEAEALRYRLYAALLAGGWQLTGDAGPETAMQAHRQRMWPFSVMKGFGMKDGMPETEE